jgi:hypothetical protein
VVYGGVENITPARQPWLPVQAHTQKRKAGLFNYRRSDGQSGLQNQWLQDIGHGVAQCNARIAHYTRRFSPLPTTNITAYRLSKMNGDFGTTPISVGPRKVAARGQAKHWLFSPSQTWAKLVQFHRFSIAESRTGHTS